MLYADLINKFYRYDTIKGTRRTRVRNLVLVLSVFHICALVSILTANMAVSFYSYVPFLYLILLSYVSNTLLLWVKLQYWPSRRLSSKVLEPVQILNGLLIFSCWCFLMVDLKVLTLICSMMVLSFMFTNSSFKNSMLLHSCICAIYLLTSYIGYSYFNHPLELQSELLTAITFFLSVTLIGKVLHKSTVQLRRQADIDNLTKLLNRRAMSIHIHQEHLRSIEANSISTLVMIDLDDFKLINDKFGHDAGDLVLVHVAKILKKHIRNTDYLSRRGGEEFLGLLVGINPYQAKEVIARALAELNREGVHYRGNLISVSFSAGITELNAGVTVESAIQEADKQMYRAKKMGKNIIVSKHQLVQNNSNDLLAAS
ncbi:MAG: hypothetical protein OFPI_31260 [Osedax symbiont Rs2]|nr:MAG: hypothetical protein OFPI_31260 [Osedax symbiont Rs2]